MEWLAGVSKLQEYIKDYWTGLAESKKFSHVVPSFASALAP